MFLFNNSYAQLPEHFYTQAQPAPFQNPRLIAWNHSLAAELGCNEEIEQDKLAQIFSGQMLLPGSDPIALAYAGHQFGHLSPMLGDGRAILLGEVRGQDMQLKGSGKTIFSRNGDGRSALGPVLREYLVSEAMHHLGVPTTRALAAVATGEDVLRQDGPEPGGVFTRVAQSHLRVGMFVYFAYQNDWDAVDTLLTYTINRHYPEGNHYTTAKDRGLYLLQRVCEKQAELVALWSGLGFIHGVMNTDNFSLAGITLDYGPCAFMDRFSFHKVFSAVDQGKRYSFFQQVPIAQWNVLRLAEALLPLIDADQKKAINIVEAEIAAKLNLFPQKRMEMFAKKLGIKDYMDTDAELVMSFLNYLEQESLDFTWSFRNLVQLFEGETQGYAQTKELQLFIQNWKNRVRSVDHLPKINPFYIPRNHQIQKAIQASYQGNDQYFHFLAQAFQTPFQQNQEYVSLATPPHAYEEIERTFCGT